MYHMSSSFPSRGHKSLTPSSPGMYMPFYVFMAHMGVRTTINIIPHLGSNFVRFFEPRFAGRRHTAKVSLVASEALFFAGLYKRLRGYF